MMITKRNILLLACFVLYCCKSGGEKAKPDPETRKDGLFINQSLSERVNNLFMLIRDRKLDKSLSAKELDSLLAKARAGFNKLTTDQYPPDTWVFPIRGYSSEVSLGGIRDEGYVPGRYDIFDGNEHGGHAALDLFVTDANQDCLDDNTKKPMEILSLTGGVVLSTETTWDTASLLRGGKYIWIFDPFNNFLLYYAHCESILVKPGQLLTPGQLVATCGRSGLNAFKKRSPTHLHLTVLTVDKNRYLKPVNPYPYLEKAKTIR